MRLSTEKVALLSGSISQQLSIITLYLHEADRQTGRWLKRARGGLARTTPLTALGCSRWASSVCHQWKWPLQHLNCSSAGRGAGLLGDQQYMGPPSHQTRADSCTYAVKSQICMHTADLTHDTIKGPRCRISGYPFGSWNIFRGMPLLT